MTNLADPRRTPPAGPGRDSDHDELVRRLRAEVAAGLAAAHQEAEASGRPLAGPDRQALATQLLTEALEQHAKACLRDGRPPLTEAAEAGLFKAVHDDMFGARRAQPLLDDPDVVNVHAVGCDPVWVELADGRKLLQPPIADSDDELIELIRDMGRRIGNSERQFDAAHPRINLQLPDGSRLFAVGWVSGRPHLYLRRHRYLQLTLDDLVGLGSLPAPLARFLTAAVRARLNLLVGGGMGHGKTTLLRALAAAVPPAEHLVTVETDYELALDRFPDVHPEVTALEAREPNVEGVGAVSCAELVRWAMRMSASRIVIGEVLGAEVIPMLNAMNAGAAGSMCTVHANSSQEVFAKLALLALQAPERLEPRHTHYLAAGALDLVVFVTLTAAGQRVVSSVREVVGADDGQVITNELWRPGPDGTAERTAVALRPDTARRLEVVGWTELSGAGR